MGKSKIVSGFLVIALVVVQFSLWTGQNGIFDYLNLQQDLKNSSDRNIRLAARNDRLIGDVVNLKSRTDAVEEIARNRLGMIKKDEVFYQIIDLAQTSENL